MQSPNATPIAVSQQNARTSQQPHVTDIRNGAHTEGAVRDPSPDSADRDYASSTAEGRDAIRDGKEKAKAILAEQGMAMPLSNENKSGGEDGSQDSQAHIGNGVSRGRKRSRSGSRVRTQPRDPASTAALKDFLLNEYQWRDQLHAQAINDQAERIRTLFKHTRADADYYKGLVPQRKSDPGAVFGPGYSGFGNGTTGSQAQLVYPAQRKPLAGRRTRPFHISRKDAAEQADQLEELVPIRLDIEFEKIKLRDTFTWNLHDRVTPSDVFAHTLVEDFRVPLETTQALVQQINRDIQEQIQDYYPHVFIEEEPLDPHLPYFAYKNDEMRVLIKLNITIGQVTLVDQLEWEINNPLNNPEEFARQMARDLSLSGEFVTAIAHCIRERTQMFTRSLYISGHPFDGRPMEDSDVREAFLPSPLSSVFRPQQQANAFTPLLYELNDADLQREELSIQREQRRQKRSVTNRRGGPALPDLKDRQRTVRTLVVSEGIPGAAETIETSRLFKMTRVSARVKRPGRGDDSSEESESEVSADESQMVVQQPMGGTARTRGMRGAASAAQAAMRANLGRSATPEVTTLHERPTRMSRRFDQLDGGREESVIEPTSHILRLKISPVKYRQFMQRLLGGSSTRSGEYQQQGQLATPLMASQGNTPQPNRLSAAGSMPPPSPAPSRPSQLPGSQSGGSTAGNETQIRYFPDGRVESTYPQPQGQSVSDFRV